jgi:hypothetical protein
MAKRPRPKSNKKSPGPKRQKPKPSFPDPNQAQGLGGVEQATPAAPPTEVATGGIDPNNVSSSSGQPPAQQFPQQAPPQPGQQPMMGGQAVMRRRVRSIVRKEYNEKGLSTDGFPYPRVAKEDDILQPAGTPITGTVPKPSWWRDTNDIDHEADIAGIKRKRLGRMINAKKKTKTNNST